MGLGYMSVSTHVYTRIKVLCEQMQPPEGASGCALTTDKVMVHHAQFSRIHLWAHGHWCICRESNGPETHFGDK